MLSASTSAVIRSETRITGWYPPENTGADEKAELIPSERTSPPEIVTPAVIPTEPAVPEPARASSDPPATESFTEVMPWLAPPQAVPLFTLRFPHEAMSPEQ